MHECIAIISSQLHVKKKKKKGKIRITITSSYYRKKYPYKKFRIFYLYSFYIILYIIDIIFHLMFVCVLKFLHDQYTDFHLTSIVP